MGRSREERSAAIARVESEGLIPLDELVKIAKAPAAVLKRWVIDGRKVNGQVVHLDGLFSRRKGTWCSSLAALQRFQAQVEAKPDAA